MQREIRMSKKMRKKRAEEAGCATICARPTCQRCLQWDFCALIDETKQNVSPLCCYERAYSALYHWYNAHSRLHETAWLFVLFVFTALCIFNLVTTINQIRDNYTSVDATRTTTSEDILPPYTMCFADTPVLPDANSSVQPAWSTVLPR